MQQQDHHEDTRGFFARLGGFFADVPLLGWFVAILAAVLLEQWVGLALAEGMGLPKIPVLFGITVMLKKPLLIPGSLAYAVLIYILPVLVVAKLTAGLTNAVAKGLLAVNILVAVVVHLAVLYAICHIW